MTTDPTLLGATPTWTDNNTAGEDDYGTNKNMNWLAKSGRFG